MAYSFTLSLTTTPAALLERAKKLAAEGDAIFQGDTSSGSFTGSGVEGNYQIDADTLTVTITDKPFFAPWALVESKIRGFFS